MHFIVWDIIVDHFLAIPLIIRCSTFWRWLFQYWNWHFITLPWFRWLIHRLRSLGLFKRFLLGRRRFRWWVIWLSSCASIWNDWLLFFLSIFFNRLHPFFTISRVRGFIGPLSIESSLLLLLFFLLLLLAINNSVFQCAAIHHCIFTLVPIFVFLWGKCLLLLRCKLNCPFQVSIVFLDLG